MGTLAGFKGKGLGKVQRHAAAGCGVMMLGLAMASAARAQIAGNSGYQGGGGKARAQQSERSERILTKEELPPEGSMFVDADVLMNVKADEYVAVFGIAQTGATVQEANDKMGRTVKEFTEAIKAFHVRESDVYVDFIAQPKIYSFEVTDRVAREKLSGFELKKNVSVHYTDRDLIDKLVTAATEAKIYDLIKVDYVVKNINVVQDKLMTEAAEVIKQKLARDAKLLGIAVTPPAEVYAERHAIHYPTELYDTYTAEESQTVSRPRNVDEYSIQYARKGRTFFFNGLDGDGYDKVLNPVIVEPVVQFTLYLKVKYTVAGAAPKPAAKP